VAGSTLNQNMLRDKKDMELFPPTEASMIDLGKYSQKGKLYFKFTVNIYSFNS
jgi:hypothetical protein